MAVFDDAKMQRIAVEAELPEEVIKWFKEQSVNSVKGMAMAFTTEAEVASMCIDPMKAANIAAAKILGTTAKVREAWTLAREEYSATKKQAGSDSTGGEEGKIPDRESKDIATAWFNRHKFVFPDNMCLVENQQYKLWKQINMDPPLIETWFAQKIRHKGEGPPTSVGQTLSVVGKSVEGATVILDLVEDKMELWMKIRAWFMTLCYVSVGKPTYFPYQLAVLVSEHVLKLITATFDKRRPPLQHMLTAWDNTAHSWSEDMRMTKRTAAEIISNFSNWEGKFAWMPAMSQMGASDSSSGASKVNAASLEADNKKLINTVASLQGTVRQMKGQAATQASQPKNQGGGKGRGQDQDPYGEDRRQAPKGFWEPKNSDGGSRHKGGGAGNGKGVYKKKKGGKK